MTNRTFTRRQALQGGAALAGALALGKLPGGRSAVPGPEDRPALVVLWLNGGPAGLFNSAGSFLRDGAFGVTSSNVRDLGNGLLVDADSLGALPESARRHMASINFRHGVIRPHEQARAAVLELEGRSRLLRLASALPAGSRRCVLVNDIGFPAGVNAAPTPKDGIALERLVDADAAAREAGPSRWAEIRAAYGAPQSSTIGDSASTFAAVEALLAAGTGVVFAQPAYTGRADRQFDTHEDDSGTEARAVMAPITPLLSTFLTRSLAMTGRNVVTLLAGEFSRTVPKSDHEPGGTATLIGRYVQTGTAGPQDPDGSPPENAPPPDALWAYAAAALRLDGAPFGRNPHPGLIAASA
jgi:hypothetical protein